MVDKLIVQLQDTSRILRSSSDESVASALRNALRCINDADKLKQVRSEKNELVRNITYLTRPDRIAEFETWFDRG